MNVEGQTTCKSCNRMSVTLYRLLHGCGGYPVAQSMLARRTSGVAKVGVGVWVIVGVDVVVDVGVGVSVGVIVRVGV